MNLLEQVRNTKTLNGGVLLYEHANIVLETVNACSVYPMALYTLSEKLSNIYRIANTMCRKGIDIFNLEETVEEQGIRISPPVVEKTDGVWGILDGIHRMSIAMKENIPVKVIKVDGASVETAFLPVGWNEVLIYKSKPDKANQLRVIRPGVQDTSEDLRKRFRDFSYLGSSGRRPAGGQSA